MRKITSNLEKISPVPQEDTIKYFFFITGEAMMARAKNFGSKSQFSYAQGMKTPSCDVLYKLGVGRVNY
jgi:hypothetical protein